MNRTFGRIQVGDTVAFRRDVVRSCGDEAALAAWRGTVTATDERWLFLREEGGRTKVMPVAAMCKVQRNGAILELV